jgi:hypothetical protein
MPFPRLVPTVACVMMLVAPARGAEPFDVERDAAAPPPPVSVIGIDARSTFLRTHNDAATPSWPINLAHLGLKPGDLIRLDALGDFSNQREQAADEFRTMIGVFSSSPTLLSGDKVNRVPGAIDAGVDVATGPTYVANRDTDIPQDFAIGSLKIRIPQGAKYLFVAAQDNFYSDNIDPDADFAVRIGLF